MWQHDHMRNIVNYRKQVTFLLLLRLLLCEFGSTQNIFWELRVRFETTVMRAVETKGVGLHSGVPVNLRITPAPASTGIVFRRTDLENFEIPASWRYVQK